MNQKKQPVRLNFWDKIVHAINPTKSLARIRARSVVDAFINAGFITFDSPRSTMQAAYYDEGSPDTDILPKLKSMRLSCRDLAMNSPIASGILSRESINAVGYGLSLQSRIDYKTLGLTPEQAEEWEENTEREFALVAESPMCDAEGMLSFYDLQLLAFLTTSMSGDCFVLYPDIPEKEMPYDVRIRLIEPDQCSTPTGEMYNDKMHEGVETDSNGKVIAYHFSKKHPGDKLSIINDGWVRIPVYSDTGRRNVSHLLRKKRPGQKRGVPLLAVVIEALKQITRLSESELAAAVVSSFLTAVVKTNSPEGPLGAGAPIVHPDGIEPTDAPRKYEMGRGTFVHLEDDESIEVIDPKRPNDSFAPFFEALVKQIGAHVNIPFEQIMLHFSSSYTAARGALLEAWKFIRYNRVWTGRYFCQPYYELWLAEAIIKGRVKAPGFFTDLRIKKAWCGTLWAGAGQGLLDPYKETVAAVQRIDNNLSTCGKEVTAIDGDDWDTMVVRRGFEVKKIAANNIPQKTSEAGAKPVIDDKEDGDA